MKKLATFSIVFAVFLIIVSTALIGYSNIFGERGRGISIPFIGRSPLPQVSDIPGMNNASNSTTEEDVQRQSNATPASPEAYVGSANTAPGGPGYITLAPQGNDHTATHIDNNVQWNVPSGWILYDTWLLEGEGQSEFARMEYSPHGRDSIVDASGDLLPDAFRITFHEIEREDTQFELYKQRAVSPPQENNDTTTVQQRIADGAQNGHSFLTNSDERGFVTYELYQYTIDDRIIFIHVAYHEGPETQISSAMQIVNDIHIFRSR